MIPVSSLILAGVIILVIAIILVILAKQYRKVGPNEVLIIAGGRKRTIAGPDGSKIKVGYRYRLGGGTFVIPFIETVYRLPMDVITLVIKTPEVLTNSGVPIMALDVPSGIDASTGLVPGRAIKAALTVAFGAPKTGALVHPARALVGRHVVVEIGFPPMEDDDASALVVTPSWARRRMPAS